MTEYQKRLYREYITIGGMVDEIIAKCRILNNRLTEEQELDGGIYASKELTTEVYAKITKYKKQLDKYKHRLSEINAEVRNSYQL